MKIETIVQKNNLLFYSIRDMSEILNVHVSVIGKRIKKLNLKHVFVKYNPKGFDCRFYSFQQVNFIFSTFKTERIKPCVLIVSDFNKVEEFIELESKINN